jgi:glycosyltransferase involved in cell wall biosynthesis
MIKMKNDNTVSVVLCTRNGISFINEQLMSLEAQTYKNIQIICSDNNSTDGTDAVLRNWCLNHENRKFVSQEAPGLNRNFFQALNFATGNYVIFCDQDDVWFPEKIERLVAFIEKHNDASMVYCLSKPFYGELPKDAAIKKMNWLEGTEVRKTLLTSFTLGHNMLVRKSVLDKIKLPATETVAYDWWITVNAMCISPIYCLPEVLTFWRQHHSNTTTQLNTGLYYQLRLSYLRTFEEISILTKAQRNWIQQAIQAFEKLETKSFSMFLFFFLINQRAFVFFFKNKKTFFGKMTSAIKWSWRMSHADYRLNDK